MSLLLFHVKTLVPLWWGDGLSAVSLEESGVSSQEAAGGETSRTGAALRPPWAL